MNGNTKQVCLQTILTLVIVATGIAIGYTNFVQAEVKEDVTRLGENQDLNTEKINSVQIQLQELRGDIKLLLERTKP